MSRLSSWLQSLGRRLPAPVQALVVTVPAPVRPRVATDAFGGIHIEKLDVLPEPRFVRVRARDRLPDNSTREHYWRHPHGHPYEVKGGPHGGDRMPTEKPWGDWDTVWTDSPILPGYRLLMDDYSDRMYHVWRGETS